MRGLKISRFPEFNLKNNQELRLCSFHSRCMKTGCKQKKILSTSYFFRNLRFKAKIKLSQDRSSLTSQTFSRYHSITIQKSVNHGFFKKIKKAHLRIILKFYLDKLLNEQWEQKLKWQADNKNNTAFHNLCRILDNCFNPVGSLRCGRRPNSRRFMMFEGYSAVKASVE